MESTGHDAAAKESGISSFLPVIAGGIASMGVILVLSVLLTVGFTKGVLSIYIGTTLIIVAFGLWLSSRWKRKESV